MFYEKGLSYRAFYERLIDFALAHPDTLIGDCCARITANLSAIDRGETISRVFVDPDFGGIEYPEDQISAKCGKAVVQLLGGLVLPDRECAFEKHIAGIQTLCHLHDGHAGLGLAL